MKIRSVIFLLSAPLITASAEEELTTEQTEFFESKIRPAMVEYCYKCHSADEKIKGGLQHDNREGLRHGGENRRHAVSRDRGKTGRPRQRIVQVGQAGESGRFRERRNVRGHCDRACD